MKLIQEESQMTRNWQHYGAMAAIVACAGLCTQVAVAQSADDDAYEEIVTIGTRSAKPRSAADSTVPIDVISGEDFNDLGGTADITDNMKAMVPSFTAAPATGDGSAFIRATSLRGTAADQTLVLINGKRRHRSALVQFLAPAAGNGAHAPDIGMIPGIGIKSVEVLRDGASSQYGSDAIAGVINFVMKDASEGGQVQVQFGEFYDGEQSVKVAANVGLPAGDNGFVNISAEYIDNDGLSRGLQRPDAQALIDGGTSGVGADAPFGDAPLVQSWGRPETSGLRLFINSGFEISDTAELYARFGYGDTEGRYRFFYRHPTTHSTFTTQLPFGAGCPGCNDPDNPDPSLPDTQSLREQGFVGLPAGFTPFLDGDQKDTSIVLGVNGEFESGMLYDFSYGFGRNELLYFLNNTANPSLGPGDLQTLPQMDFDVGGYEQKELMVNADFSLPMSDRLNLAFGFEWREETYSAIAGEPTSFFEKSASGLKGVTSEDAGSHVRDNVAVYVDLEHDISDALLLQYALRYEDFSDFGDTINWKVAGRYRFSDAFAIRGAVSTGFHAPTPGQANVRTTITTADSTIPGQTILVEEGLFPATDPAAIAVGAQPLTEETSVNYSLGFTSDIGDNTTLTVDVYLIEVDDRIYKTGNIPTAAGGQIAFYTNAMDVEHTGLDVVLTSNTDWTASTSTTWTVALNYMETDVVGQKTVQTPDGPFTPVGAPSVVNIENDYPNERAVVSANTFFADRFNLMFRANYYGEHLDQEGVIGVNKPKVDSIVYLDLDLGFQLNDNWRFNLGAINIADEFINETGPPDANNLSSGLQYPRRAAANYEGGQYYLRGTYSF
jgi:iron complex outermembrane receptor protein